MARLLGIDEAGRGPVIGPMVLAGVMIHDKDDRRLKDLGVKDSKLLTPARRQELFNEIKRLALDYKIVIVQPNEIDEAVLSSTSNLNLLEAEKAAAIIRALKPDRVFVDSPSVNTKAFTEVIATQVGDKKIDIVCKNKADVLYPSVSAASILAKVTRDREIEKLKKRFKVEFGSGYPSDPFTMAFLKDNYSKYPIFRKSWASFRNAASKRSQTKLGLFNF